MGCPPEQLSKIHSGGTQDGIYHISFSSFEAVTVHPVFSFEMSDARFNRCASFHPTPETLSCSASSWFIHMNFDAALVIMPAVASVDKDMERFFCNAFYLSQGICQCMAVVRVSVNCHGAERPLKN